MGLHGWLKTSACWMGIKMPRPVGRPWPQGLRVSSFLFFHETLWPAKLLT